MGHGTLGVCSETACFRVCPKIQSSIKTTVNTQDKSWHFLELIIGNRYRPSLDCRRNCMLENLHGPSKQTLQKTSLPLKEIQNGLGKKSPHLSQVPITASSRNRPREKVLMQRPGMELLPAEEPKAQFVGVGGGKRGDTWHKKTKTKVRKSGEQKCCYIC